MRCTRCGFENPSGSRFCENCGAVLQAEERRAQQPVPVQRDTAAINNRICPNCGSLIEDGAPFCVNCGQSMYEVHGGGGGIVYEEEPKSGGTLKMIIIGAVIGLAILAGIFVVMHFMNKDHEEAMEPPTTETTVRDNIEEEFDDLEEDKNHDSEFDDLEEDKNHDTDYDDYTSDDREDYSDYDYYSQEELYRSGVPMFFPSTDSRILSDSEIARLSEDQRQKVINDIYARNGKIFTKFPYMQKYYESQSWYSSVSGDDDEIRARMNEYETKNIEHLVGN